MQELIQVLNQYEEDDLITAGELKRIIALAENKKNQKAIKAELRQRQELP